MNVQINKSYARRLDRLVEWTGIPAIMESSVRRRNLRWWPILSLAVSTVGLVVAWFDPGHYWRGYSAVIAAFVVGVWIPMVGPIKIRMDEDADERERTLRRDAYLVTFAAISVMAICGLLALLGLTAVQSWTVGALAQAVLVLVLFLMNMLAIVPTLYASWTTVELDHQAN